MTFVIVGGGPTGVEMAGALGELKLRVLPRDYPELDFNKMKIHIIDLSERLLSTMSPEASESAAKFLKRFGIDVWLKTQVVSYDGKFLVLSNGKQLCSNNVIWAAGVKGAIIPGLNENANVGGRIKVDVHNRVTGYTDIFAIGDVAAVVTDKTPKGHPMLAPVAIQQAQNLANNFKRMMSNKPLRPFYYKHLGVMATVGRNHAVVDFSFIKFGGMFAWFVWLFVHLMALVGFRNKIVAFVNWAWNYFSFDRGLRIIIQPFRPK